MQSKVLNSEDESSDFDNKDDFGVKCEIMVSNVASKHYKNNQISPCGRYERFPDIIHKAQYIEIYLAADSQTGQEVGWAIINLTKFSKVRKERILK